MKIEPTGNVKLATYAENLLYPINFEDISVKHLKLIDTTIPSTSSNEASLFVSDGSDSSLIQNRLYYRYEYNGNVVPLTVIPNIIVISSLSDLPDPIGNAINLDPTKVYYFSGIVDIGTNYLTSIGPITIRGTSPLLDRIITNSTTPLISGNATINIKFLRLQNSGGNIFNCDGGGGSNNFVVKECASFAIGGNSFGNILNYNFIRIDNVSILESENGLTISGNNGIVYITSLSAPGGGTGTFTALTISAGTVIDNFRIFDGIYSIGTGQTGFNIDNTVTITNGPAHIDHNSFSGSGTYLSGVTSETPNFDFFENIGINDSNIIAEVGFSSSTPTIIPSYLSYSDISTSPLSSIYTTFTGKERFQLSNDENGEIEYNGVINVKGNVNVSLSVQSNGGNQDIVLGIFVDNGSGYTLCSNSEFYSRIRSDPIYLNSTCFINIVPGIKIKPQLKKLGGGGTSYGILTCSIYVNTV